MCTSAGAKVDSNRLSMDSFWGLYLITGAASAFALLIFICRMLYYFIKDPNIVAEENSKGKSIKSFAKYLDRKEASSRASKVRKVHRLLRIQIKAHVMKKMIIIVLPVVKTELRLLVGPRFQFMR